jgi:hypothetical protein
VNGTAAAVLRGGLLIGCLHSWPTFTCFFLPEGSPTRMSHLLRSVEEALLQVFLSH